jgi:hypothetical protein
MKHTVELVLGDWSDDGHGKTATFVITSNLDGSGIEKAYQAGTKILGFDFSETVCEDYGDTSLPISVLEKLVEHGFDKSTLECEDSLWRDSFRDIYLFIVKLGEPNFEFSFILLDSLKIGGYGLF